LFGATIAATGHVQQGRIVAIDVRSPLRLGLLVGLAFGSVSSALAAAPAAMSARIETVYTLLGQGEMERAADLSATLATEVDDGNPHRAAVLQARLDALDQRVELDKPAGQALHDAVQRFATHSPQGQALADRFAIAAARDSGKTQVALTLAQDLLAAPVRRSAEDVAELQAAQARAAALVNGQLGQAGTAARIALDALPLRHGQRSAWRQVQLDNILGTAFEFSGSKSEALAWFERASKLAVASFGADSLTRIKTDTSRAVLLVELGRNSEAQAIREAVLAATQHRYGEHSVESAKSEAMVGAGLQEIGDYTAARVRYASAEQTLASAPDAPARERGVIATNYGNLLQEMGEEEAALAHYRQALALWGDNAQMMRARAVVSANMGNTEFRLGHYDVANADFQRALALREQSDGKDAAGLAFALEGLGSSALALKRYAEAEQYFGRALRVRGRALPPNHPTLAVFNFGLALAHWGQGHSDDAFRYAKLTAENQQQLLGTFATEFSERQSVAYRDILVPATALVVTLAAERGDADSIVAAWRLAMIERSLVARAQAHRLAAARALHDPALAAVWHEWQRANSALGEAWLGTNSTPEHMAQLRAQAEGAERALWLHVGHDPGSDIGKGIDMATLKQALPADGLLLAFSEGVAADSARLLAAGDKAAPEDWYAFALGAGTQPTLRRVGRTQALSAQVRAWYADLRNPASDPERLRRNGLALRQALLDPFASLADKRRLFIVPEGELFRVSFAALPDDRHGYLVETGTRVHTLAHEGDLLLAAATTAPATTLLAGAPVFPHVTTDSADATRQLCLRAARQGFAAIPNAARELEGLHALLAAATPDAHVELVAGAAATKDNVLAAMPRANIIHLATHGFSLDDSCADTAGARGVSTVPASIDATATSNASALSGLAFSGAQVAQGHNPVGVLSAGELGTLDLSQADWIALSACDSGLGPIGRNEGVFGMRRALRLAGARTVVMSLWQVDDAATADLMQALYRARFVEHRDVPEAMTVAMRQALDTRRALNVSTHPYYWAAFVSEGGWR
jgi:CHAT domain-containing protein/tetratricopeptide (TPR) repeat protein